MNCLRSHINLSFRKKGDASKVKNCVCNVNVSEIVYESIRFLIVHIGLLKVDSLEAIFHAHGQIL